MFEYANSLNQRRKLTRRIYTAWTASFLIHLAMLVMLIQFPQLLRGGLYHRFRPLSMITNILGGSSEDAKENWRTVTVLRGPMIAPSTATLKKYLYDWNKKSQAPKPVTVPLTNQQKAALENRPPLPKLRQDQKPTVTLPAPGELAGISAGQAPAGESAAAQGSSAAVRDEEGAGRKNAVELPPPVPAPKPEVAAAKAAPSAIPNGVKPPANTPADSVKVFENEQKAIRSSESGFFDTKGFPLGEYANAIKEKIKGNWYIPSNLKKAQGHTTIVFYIGKDGRYTNARIEPSTSSGNSSLDLAALKAIMDSNPFPPLPKGFPGDHLGAKFVLSYNE